MEYVVGLSIFAILGYACFHIIRKKHREHNPEYDIPPFLRRETGDDSSYDPGDKSNTADDWYKIYPHRLKKSQISTTEINSDD